MSNKGKILWQDRKRTLFGLPWSFTEYELTKEKLNVSIGLINSKEEEIRLYRILDVSLSRPFSEKIFGLGTLRLITADKSAPELELKRIKNPRYVRDLISDMVDEQRKEKGISGREILQDPTLY